MLCSYLSDASSSPQRCSHLKGHPCPHHRNLVRRISGALSYLVAPLFISLVLSSSALATTVSAIRPNSGGSAGGSTIEIDGTGLDTATAVTFGGAPATIVVATPTVLTVATTTHAAGVVDVVIANPGGPTTAIGAFTYVNNDNVARDFSIAANPSPRWSYGWEAARGGTFNLYLSHSRGTVDVWTSAGLPNLWHNASASPVVQATNLTQPGQLGLHPGSGGENSVARWTAPASGTYRIVGDFRGLDATFPTTTDVAILKNNDASVPLFSGNIASYDVPLPFSADVVVAAGETIEFTVGFGINGYTGDATGLDATITLLAAATIDVDRDNHYDALTDGLLLIRYLSGLTGSSLTAGALGVDATRKDPGDITQYLDGIRVLLDVDGNHQAELVTDGLMLIRYLFGLRGSSLTGGAIGMDATRSTSQIETHIQSLMP
jgi:hypothetical protein